MHAKINIFYTVLVQNIENRKLHSQVDSVDAGLNRESKSHGFFSLRSLYCIHESFQGKIIHAENYWIFIIVIKFTIIGADIADGRHDQLTAHNRRRLFGVYSWPAAGDIYARTTPNWVKLLPIYERDIGQAAASPISRPSSPLSAINSYKSSAPRLYFLTGHAMGCPCAVLYYHAMGCPCAVLYCHAMGCPCAVIYFR